MPRTCCALALCLSLAGCYASHERAADAGHDSGVVDASGAAHREVAFSSEGILAAWWDRRSPEVWVRPMAPRGGR